MKAQSPIISHTFLAAFSLFLIFIVVTTMSHLDNEYRSFAGNNEVKQVCGIIKQGIEKMYMPTDYRSPDKSTMGSMKMILPEKIAGIIYKAVISSNAVYVTTTSDPVINATCITEIAANLSGSTTGGETELVWISYPEKDEIIMRQVNQ